MSAEATDTRLKGSSLSSTAPFWIVHAVCLLAVFTGVHLTDLIVAAVLYAVGMFAVTAGYHRYFSHRTYKTSRAMQFVLAWLAMQTAQKGVLWWAAHHRHHHRHSDDEHDVHSVRHKGFWWAHAGWILSDEWSEPDGRRVRDLSKYPELVWLNRHPMVPPTVLAVAVLALFGWSGLIVGFFWSLVVLWHATFTINSLSHVFGTQRYETGDDSRNNPWLALLTFGEGWHNNHHHYQASVRQGFRWYEFDLTYYVLRAMSWVGLVWDLKQPPRWVVYDEPHPLNVADPAPAE